MQVIRWGIVGPGNIARKFARAMKKLPGAELAAVATRSMERGKAFAKKYDIPLIFEGYEAMAQSDAVDAVYIATPHPFHLPAAMIYLKAKKHVLSEKPLCVNAEEARKLKKCAEENGVFLMEAMWTRFLPAVQKAVALAESGKIGKVLGVRADFCYALTPEQEPKIFRTDMAGGSLLDVGVYGLHFAGLFLGDEPEKITAEALIEYGVDSHTNIVLKYLGGAIASVSSATVVHKPSDAYVYGTDGYLYFPDFYKAQEFFLCRKGRKDKCFAAPSIGEGFEEEILEACRCIREGRTESDTLPISKSIRILEQMDEIRRQIGVKYPFDECDGEEALHG